MTNQELQVVNAMRIYGGSFVKSLAECFIHADSSNFDILKKAFPTYWTSYENMAKRKDSL
jgi:pyruvate/2-oxoacid:ferredoxin oxidoreductase beta subunit